MLLSILDEKTFMVGGKTFKVGTELKLDEMKTPVVFPWGEASVVEVNEHMAKTATLMRKTRTALSARLHMVEEDFDEEAARLSVDYENLERDWLYYSDVFYKAVQNHVGGQLPLIRDPDTGAITVRAKQPQETLNYLRDVCSQRVRFHNYESMRPLALHLTGGDKNEVAIESELHIDTQVPVVSANYMGDKSTSMNKPLLEWLVEGITATYDEVTKYGPVAGIVWANSNKPNEPLYGRAYFLNAGALLRQGQGDPKLALTTAIQRCQGKLPHPFAMGFFIYGNMPLVRRAPKKGEDEKSIPIPRGVLISTLKGEESNYKILIVDTEQRLTVVKEGDDVTKLKVAQEGDESKLDKAIIDVAKAAMRLPEVEPKEEEPPAEEPPPEEPPAEVPPKEETPKEE